MEIRDIIKEGKQTALGIEFGSTRIKAVLIDSKGDVLASGSHEWENRWENGIWTYSMDDITSGLVSAYSDLKKDVKEKYGITLTGFGAMGISAMMHGYLAFDKDDNLLVPFRTWRNATTGDAAEILTKEFNFNIPLRWSVAHLYHAILNKEEHVSKIAFVTTLAGFIHYKLTGKKVLGVGDASGMFPIDSKIRDYNREMKDKFNKLIAPCGFDWDFDKVFPKVLVAGEDAGTLTKEGAAFLDPQGDLECGMPVCPPEGDAGTGMTATNSVAVRTGNVSAGTSVFSMIVMEHDLKKVHPEIDVVTTPSGDSVAMVHCNNCTNEINAWAGIFKEFADVMGASVNMGDIYTKLFNLALTGEPECGGLLGFNYLSGEPVSGFEEGRPLFVRNADSRFNLANFMRLQLYMALAALKGGNDILMKEEDVKVDKMLGHGGYFKTTGVGQRMLSAALDTEISCMETAGEGGAWGIAVLALYEISKAKDESLSDFLNDKIFAGMKATTLKADKSDVEGFNKFMERYKKGLKIEASAIENLN